jgi:hypothetical protein
MRTFGFIGAMLLVLILVIAVTMKFSHQTDTTFQRPPAPTKASEPVSTRSSRVPFVGCKSDGQTGPVTAPEGESKVVLMDAKAAQQLAYYASQKGFGVFAPRGWFCFGTYGSNGDTLYVSPQPINAADLLTATWTGFTGPAIQLSRQHGDTSGRSDVAKTIARAFPARRAFARTVIDDGTEPASSFSFRPYPNDRLTYRSNEIVEYQTPANTEGLGTNSSLQSNADPISGVAILIGTVPDLLQLSVRLPMAQVGLTPFIIGQVERDNAHQDSGASQVASVNRSDASPTMSPQPKTAKGYPVPEDTFVDAYVLANLGRDDLDQDQLTRLGRDEYKTGKEFETQTLLASGGPVDTRGKRAMDYISRLHPQQNQVLVYQK